MKIFADELDLYEEIKKADAGDGEAMIKVAFRILFAHPNEEVDLYWAERAIEYYEKAAALGYKSAMIDLGAIYMDGEYVEKDIEKSLEWYRKGYDPESGKSCFCLGCVARYDYPEDGEEVPTADINRIKEAISYFERGAALNHADCLYELGELYLSGTVVEQDCNKAFEYFSRANDEIDPELVSGRAARIKWRLGCCCKYGWGTDKDKESAVEYLEDALWEWNFREDWGYEDEGYYRTQAKKELDELKKPFEQLRGCFKRRGALSPVPILSTALCYHIPVSERKKHLTTGRCRRKREKNEMHVRRSEQAAQAAE